MSERKRPEVDGTAAKEHHTEDDLLDEVTAADDTGMVSNEATIARIEIEEGLA